MANQIWSSLALKCPLATCARCTLPRHPIARRSWRAAGSVSGSNHGIAGAHLVQPRLVFAVPHDGLPKAFIELHRWLPTQLAAGLLAVDGVAQVVSRPIGDELDKTLGPSECAQNQLGYLDVAHLAATADVVNLALAATLQNGIERAAMIVYVNPVAHIEACTVNRKALSRHRLRDHQRNEFFRELIRSVVIGAARNDRRELMGVNIRQHQQIGSRFGRGVRAVRLQRRLFREVPFVAEAAVNLVGADVDKSRHARFAAGLDEVVRSIHVGAHKCRSVFDAAVDVAFGGEVDDGIAAAERLNHRAITDVHLHEFAAALLQRRLKVLKVASVGELVKNRELPFRMLCQREMNKVGANESSAARDQQLHRLRTMAGSCVLRSTFSRTMLLACQSDSNVPASVHQPSSSVWRSVPSAM